jgi:hypothetical protein
MLINIFKLPSSISWCEANYIISEYIAEFWNSLSGIALIMSGILYYYNNKKWIKNNNEIKFEKITKLLCVIGCGTILFHGSLLYVFQLLDEIPMILLVREYIYILLMLKTTKKCISENTCKNIIRFTNNIYEYIFMIMYSYILNKKLQIVLFHLTFKILEISLLIILYNLSKSLNKIVYNEITKNYNELYKPPPLQYLNNEDMIGALNIVQYNIKKYADLRKKIKRSIRIGFTFYSLSMFLWVLENRFCNYTQKYQFHALWHVFSSIGVYYLNDIIKYHIEINKFLMY